MKVLSHNKNHNPKVLIIAVLTLFLIQAFSVSGQTGEYVQDYSNSDFFVSRNNDLPRHYNFTSENADLNLFVFNGVDRQPPFSSAGVTYNETLDFLSGGDQIDFGDNTSNFEIRFVLNVTQNNLAAVVFASNNGTSAVQNINGISVSLVQFAPRFTLKCNYFFWINQVFILH